MSLSIAKLALLDELEKIAKTRAVKEFQRAEAAGDQGTASQIAQASGQLGLKPRYVGDISTGGAEAGVDKMMGRVQNPNTGEVNESGLLARKLYKPDSSISRAEFTPQLLQQKQQATDVGRSLSPEAKNMLPNMYGHTTMNADNHELQRTTSYHEYVPGMQDIRGKNTGTEDKPVWSNRPGASKAIGDIKQHVLNPMEARGMALGDVSNESGTNYGNVASTPQGTKIVDFLPKQQGQANPAFESFKKYAPMGSKFEGPNANMNDLRKEVFKPQMRVQPATADQKVQAMKMLQGEAPAPAPAGGANSVASAPTTPVPSSVHAPTARAAPMAMQRPAVQPPPAAAPQRVAPLAIHSDPFPQRGAPIQAKAPVRAPVRAPMPMPSAGAMGAFKKPGLLTRAASLFH
jgi:hypothetical protein